MAKSKRPPAPASAPPPEARPLPAWLPQGDAVVAAATLGPIGRMPAPGTWGTLAGLLLVPMVTYPVPVALVGLVPLWVVAAYVCGQAELRLRRTDPPNVVLDEAVALPLAALTIPWQHATWGWWLLGAFVLFRLFDIFKPLGIGALQRLPGGWGIVADDLAAAGATALLLALLRVGAGL